MISRLCGHLRDHPSWVDLGLPALTVVFGVQSVRVLFSLASFLLRDTFQWDAQYIGALGLPIFSTAFLSALLRRLLGLRLMLMVTAGGLGALRLAMQAWSGEPLLDFVLASAAVILFLLFLPAYVGYGRGRQETSRGFALGLLLGLSVDLALHGAYTTYDLGWDDRINTLLVIGVLVALQLALLWGLLARVVDPEPERASEVARQSSWRQVLPWLGLGPFLFLQLLVLQNLARLVALTEWSFPMAYTWALFSHAAGVMAGLWALNSGWRSQWPLAAIAGAALVAALAVPWGSGASSAGVLLVGQVASAVLLVMIVVGQGRTNANPSMVPATVVHGFAMVLIVGMLFGYYVIYDIDLPFGNALLPPLAGVLLGICGLAAVSSMPGVRLQRPNAWLPAPLSLLLLFVPLLWSLSWESPETSVGTGYPVRVMTYNLHNGFDTDGHLGMEAIARVIEAEQPDVIGLQEVSRGWVVNGSLDMLTWLSQRLEMPYVFGPATGSLWGNAILSRYPILEWENVKLPPNDLLFQRGYLWARLDLGDGQELRVVDTHLHHTREDFDIRARQVQTLLDFWKDGEQTVIMGDFNARRDDSEAEMMRQAGFADAIDVADISPGYTAPAEAPRYRIDYIWLSPDLTATDTVVPRSLASDHFPVVAIIAPES